MKKSKLRYFAASFLMLLSTITPLGRAIPSAYADETLPVPVTNKTISSNGDGTYKITLSVTGRASSSQDNTKANIVVVFDSSGSMDSSTTANKYEERTYGRYGLVNNEYTQLYYWSNYWNEYREVGNNDNHGTVYYIDESSETGYTQYSGTRYNQVAQNRLQVAKGAVNGLAEKLLAFNTTTGVNDMVEMAFIDFASNVKTSTTHTTPTTSLDTFQSWVNATEAEGGTNWEDALTTANGVSFSDSDPVYIVFVSDGNPTFRNSRYNNSANDCNEYQGTGSNRRCVRWGNGRTDPNNYNLGAAQSVASTIVTNKTLYAVGVFGDASNMQNLNSNAIYKDAADQAALEAAFDDIVKAITNSLSLTGVTFTDGITGMTEAVIEGKAGDFTYMKGGSVWADAPAATYDEDTKTVKWNLGETVLLDGETASISFNVYPSQESIDLVADLNNGKKSYDSLTAEQKAQIVQSGSAYTLKTNTDSPSLKYKVVQTTTVNGQSTTTISGEKEITIANPDPVGLPTDKITLEKLWEDSLDPSQREEICEDAQGNPLEVCEVVMDFYKDGEKYNPYSGGEDQNPAIHITKDTDWKLANYISIAPGLMVAEGQASYDDENHQVVTFNGTKYAILRTGHEYYFDEHDINNHYQLTNYRYQPMEILYGGELKLMNVKFIKDSDGKITAVESMTEMTTVSATNTIKGGINIQKKVYNEENQEVTDSKDAFKVKATLKNPDGTAYADTDYRIYYGENNPEYESHIVYNEDGTVKYSRTGHLYSESGIIEETLYVGDTIRIVNVDSDVLYAVEENNIPKGYSLIGVDHTIKYGQDGEEKTDTVAKTEGGLNFYAVVGNSASAAILKNRYVSGNLEISKKVEVDSGNETVAKSREFAFEITIYSDATKATELTTPYKIDGKDEYLKSGDTFRMKDGDTVKLLKLPEGAYYEIVEKGVYIGDTLMEFSSENNYGWTSEADGDTGTIVKNQTKEAEFTNTYSVSGEVTIEAKKQFNDWQAGDSFLFELSGGNIAEGEEMSVSVREGETAEFVVPFDDAATYTYTITESLTGLRGGITKTSGDITVSVTATDNGVGGLDFTVGYTGGEGDEHNTIVNEYAATGSIQLGASKLLTGRDWLEGETYTFTLFQKNGDDVTCVLLGNGICSAQQVSESAPTATFDEIVYNTTDAGQTYVYIIRETSDLPDGVTNSGDITATVTIEDNHDGTLTTTVVYTNDKGEVYNTIVNTYSANGEFEFEASKLLTGRDWKNGESYNFVLKDSTGKVLDTQPVNKNGKVTFAAQAFTQADAGEHTFTISETGTMPSGLTASGPITVTLNVTDNLDGTLSFEADYSGDATITNTYQSTGEVELQATKVLTGRDWLENESYDFVLKKGSEEIDRKTVDENETVTFKKIDYTQADAGKTYTYTISEEGTLRPGLSKSDDITVTVELTDNGQGAITPKVTYSKTDKTITNTYVASGSVDLQATKELVGRDWLENESYDFVLKKGSEEIDRKTVDENETVTFKKINYTQADAGKTYTYTISEEGTLRPGLSKSDDITVTVEVKDNGDGTLSAEPSYTDNGKITNTYSASGEVTIDVTKVFEGREWKDESFTFQLTGPKIDEPITKTVTKDNPTATFDTITYDEADAGEEYVYTVEEIGDLPASVTSSGTLTVYVNIYDNGDGTLRVDDDYVDGHIITNTYKADGDIELKATKELVGRDWLEDESYEFVLKEKGAADEIDRQTVDENETVTFKKIHYTEADAGKTYTYYISEEGTLKPGLSRSDAIEVTVEVTDDGQGGIVAEASYSNNGTITNTYVASGSVELEATKELVGRDWLENESYDFVLSGKDGEIDRQTVDANETVHFEKIEYDQTDAGQTYTYTITEDGTLKQGLSKSDDITVTVEVKDNGDGTMSADASYSNNGTITNTYEATGSIELELEKELVGRDWLDDESYTFALEYGEEGDMTIYDRQSISENGKVTFKALEFDQDDAGQTYYYTIEEVSDLPASVTSSGSVKVTVKITDNEDGTLKVEAEYTNDGKITNTYTAEGSVELKATKELVGRDWLEGESYEFVLSGDDGEIDRQTVDANETVTFEKIKYDQTDAGQTYTYTITEEGTLKPGIEKSGDITVTVVLEDDGEGHITAKSIEYTNDGKITNTYKTDPVTVEVPFTAKKKVNDNSNSQEKADGTFKFELRTVGGDLVQTKTITTSGLTGSVAFDAMTFDEEGTYEYTVSEINDEQNQPGYTYDATFHIVRVIVKDNPENAKLEAKVTIDGKEASEVEFVNDYKAEESDPVSIKVKKTLTGLEDMDKAKEFEFVLSDEDGEIETVKIKGSGEAEFETTLSFEEAGTYTYYVEEKNGGATGYEYDNSKYTVTIEVTDNGNAKLVAEVSYTKDGGEASAIEFTNKYSAKGIIYGCPECTVPLGIKKTLTGRELVEGEFTFEIYLDGELVTTGYNTADGRVLFDYGLEFNKPGTYNFTVKENLDNRLKDVAYDENEYEFTIVVEDKGEGVLEVTKDTSGDVMFINHYEEDPGQGEEPPKTFDDIMVSMATFVISLIGLIGGVMMGKRYLKDAK